MMEDYQRVLFDIMWIREEYSRTEQIKKAATALDLAEARKMIDRLMLNED